MIPSAALRRSAPSFESQESRSSGPIKKHFAECTNSQIRLEDIDILTSTIKSDTHLCGLKLVRLSIFLLYIFTDDDVTVEKST